MRLIGIVKYLKVRAYDKKHTQLKKEGSALTPPSRLPF